MLRSTLHRLRGAADFIASVLLILAILGLLGWSGLLDPR